MIKLNLFKSSWKLVESLCEEDSLNNLVYWNNKRDASIKMHPHFIRGVSYNCKLFLATF